MALYLPELSVEAPTIARRGRMQAYRSSQEGGVDGMMVGAELVLGTPAQRGNASSDVRCERTFQL
jgi:hypothetical protein